MTKEEHILLRNFLSSLLNQWDGIELSLSLRSNLSRAYRFLRKQSKQRGLNQGLSDERIERSAISILRILADNVQQADKLSNEHPLWRSLHKLKRKARVSNRSNHSTITNFKSFSEIESIEANRLLQNYKTIDVIEHKDIHYLLKFIHAKHRYARRVVASEKERSIDTAEVNYLSVLINRLTLSPIGSYDHSLLKGLVAKILNRRLKQWQARGLDHRKMMQLDVPEPSIAEQKWFKSSNEVISGLGNPPLKKPSFWKRFLGK